MSDWLPIQHDEQGRAYVEHDGTQRYISDLLGEQVTMQFDPLQQNIKLQGEGENCPCEVFIPEADIIRCNSCGNVTCDNCRVTASYTKLVSCLDCEEGIG